MLPHRSVSDRRCPCGCGIFMGADDWYERDFHDGRCKLCGKPAVASVHRERVSLPFSDGEETHCPLCHARILENQLERHARELAKARDLLRDVADSGVAFEDGRINYLEVQIDRDTWEQIGNLLEAHDAASA